MVNLGCRQDTEDPALSRCWGKGLSSEFLGFLPQPGLLWEYRDRPMEGSALRKGGQSRCQGSPQQLLAAGGSDSGRQSPAEQQQEWLEGLVSKPRSKELSRFSSEPGMRGGHPQGASWGRGQEGSQGVPREGRGLGQIKGEHPRTDVC